MRPGLNAAPRPVKHAPPQVNWLLLGLKIVAYVVSRSKAVLASLADSGGAGASWGEGVLMAAPGQRRGKGGAWHRLPLPCQCCPTHTPSHNPVPPTQPHLTPPPPPPPLVDLASQLVLALAEHKKDRYHPRYPVGRARLEVRPF